MLFPPPDILIKKPFLFKVKTGKQRVETRCYISKTCASLVKFFNIKPVKTGFVWVATGFNLLGKKRMKTAREAGLFHSRRSQRVETRCYIGKTCLRRLNFLILNP